MNCRVTSPGAGNANKDFGLPRQKQTPVERCNSAGNPRVASNSAGLFMPLCGYPWLNSLSCPGYGTNPCRKRLERAQSPPSVKSLALKVGSVRLGTEAAIGGHLFLLTAAGHRKARNFACLRLQSLTSRRSSTLPGQIPLPSPRQSRMPTSSSFPTDRGFNFQDRCSFCPFPAPIGDRRVAHE